MLVFDWLLKITNIESALFHSWMINRQCKVFKDRITPAMLCTENGEAPVCSVRRG